MSIPPECDSELQRALSCETTAAFSCDANGVPRPTPSCDTQFLDLDACMGRDPGATGGAGAVSGSGGTTGSGGTFGSGGTGGGSAEVQADCEIGCQLTTAHACPNDPPISSCMGDCATTAVSLAGCALEFDALVRCAETATFECNASGLASPVGCDDQFAAVFQCVGA